MQSRHVHERSRPAAGDERHAVPLRRQRAPDSRHAGEMADPQQMRDDQQDGAWRSPARGSATHSWRSAPADCREIEPGWYAGSLRRCSSVRSSRTKRAASRPSARCAAVSRMRSARADANASASPPGDEAARDAVDHHAGYASKATGQRWAALQCCFQKNHTVSLVNGRPDKDVRCPVNLCKKYAIINNSCELCTCSKGM